jgi:hypothetical protein
MAIKGRLTLDGSAHLIVVDQDPLVYGAEAPNGSFALYDNGLYFKAGSGNNDWSKLQSPTSVLTTASNSTLTLNENSDETRIITGNTSGQKVNLGDATKYHIGKKFVVHNNQNDHEVEIVNYSSASLKKVSPKGTLQLTLKSKDTSDGDWLIENTNSRPVFDMGDGSDGDVTISGTVTLTRSTFYENLTVQNGGTLNTGGFKIYVRNKLTVESGGKIQRNGNSGSAGGATGTAGTGGSVLTSVDLGGASAGGNGTAGSTTNATQPSGLASANPAMGGQSGNGGQGGNGSGGTGGPLRASSVPFYRPVRHITDHLIAGNSLIVGGQSGPGGAGGGGSGSLSGAGGGGGGTGGGVVGIFCHILDNNGDIEAKGGDGGNGGNASNTNTGGGGGGGAGGGGVVWIITDIVQNLGTISAAGGSGGNAGNGNGSGTAGTAGQVGAVGRTFVYEFSNETWSTT